MNFHTKLKQKKLSSFKPELVIYLGVWNVATKFQHSIYEIMAARTKKTQEHGMRIHISIVVFLHIRNTDT